MVVPLFDSYIIAPGVCTSTSNAHRYIHVGKNLEMQLHVVNNLQMQMHVVKNLQMQIHVDTINRKMRVF